MFLSRDDSVSYTHLSTHIVCRFEHELHFLQTCAKTAGYQTEDSSYSSLYGAQQVRGEPSFISNIITGDKL